MTLAPRGECLYESRIDDSHPTGRFAQWPIIQLLRQFSLYSIANTFAHMLEPYGQFLPRVSCVGNIPRGCAPLGCSLHTPHSVEISPYVTRLPQVLLQSSMCLFQIQSPLYPLEHLPHPQSASAMIMRAFSASPSLDPLRCARRVFGFLHPRLRPSFLPSFLVRRIVFCSATRGITDRSIEGVAASQDSQATGTRIGMGTGRRE